MHVTAIDRSFHLLFAALLGSRTGFEVVRRHVHALDKHFIGFGIGGEHLARFALVFAGQNLYVIAFSDIKIVHQSILR